MVCECICQICICGKHTCPVHGRSSLTISKGEICKVTEYSNRYRVPELCQVKSCKPEQCVPESGDFCADTTTKCDYKAHDSARRDLIKYNDTLKNKGNLDTTTMYRKEFPIKEICKTRSCKPDIDWCKPEQEFPADTTQRSDYKAWAQKPRNTCKKVSEYREYRPPLHTQKTPRSFPRPPPSIFENQF